MLAIRTVLCPVDLTEASTREAQQAVEICRSFGARLILHHSLSDAPFGMSNSWMWHQEHDDGHSRDEMAAARLRELLSTLPEEVQAEALLSNGRVTSAILELEDQVEADLVVMATHGPTSEDHESVAEQLVEGSRCPVLILHGTDGSLRLDEERTSGLLPVLVPTDLSPSAEPAVRYAFDLARVLPLQLHLLHVIPPRKSTWVETGVSMGGSQVREGAPSQKARDRLAALVPDDLKPRVAQHVEIGDPAEKIEEISGTIGVSCIVMGAHARSFLRHFLTRDTSLALLRRAPCPVWFVPQSQAA